MALPKPVWSGDDIEMAGRDARSLIWKAWNEDPTKISMLRAIFACQVGFHRAHEFDREISAALAQRYVCFIFIGHEGSSLIHSFQVTHNLRTTLWMLFRRPVRDVAEENQ